jgi:sugar phosphate isomerase/epimerase
LGIQYLAPRKINQFIFTMLNRRTFLKNAALGAATLPFIETEELFAPIPKHIGVQLWSVRDDMAKDPKKTLEAIAKMGYREVEPFGFNDGKLFGMSYDEFSAVLKANGLTMPSTHSMFTTKMYDAAANDITDAGKKILDDAAKYGVKYNIVPYMIDDDRKNIETVVKMFNAAGKYAKKAGVRFAYHNHDFEYKTKASDGRSINEWLLHEVDAAHLAMQMDLYWVVYANHNPLDWFKAYPGRWELVHAKDLAKTEKRETCEVGDGAIDFKSIFKQSAKAGIKHFVVELENYVTTPLEGVKKARTGLLKTF